MRHRPPTDESETPQVEKNGDLASNRGSQCIGAGNHEIPPSPSAVMHQENEPKPDQ